MSNNKDFKKPSITLPILPYGGVLEDIEFSRLVEAYVAVGYLVEDSEGEAIHPRRKIRTTPVLKFCHRQRKLLTTDSFYSVLNWGNIPKKLQV